MNPFESPAPSVFQALIPWLGKDIVYVELDFDLEKHGLNFEKRIRKLISFFKTGKYSR